ncbi:hypothetical protein ACHAWF_002256 [Thalassiosira exigua]
MIYQHRGIAVSYFTQGIARPGHTCMVRMEMPEVIDEIERVKDKHRRAVLGEQARQAMLGTMDAESLRKASCDSSKRCVEMASSSWWLKRMNYRCV